MVYVAEAINAFGKLGAKTLEAEQHQSVAGSLQAVLNCKIVLTRV